jgi:Domain of unknown function (DU1801)
MTVEQYLRELDPDRRRELQSVRATVNEHLPRGYVERINWGMITWEIPLSKYPETYNGQPLCYAALAAKKSCNTLHLMGAYADPAQAARFKKAFEDQGKRLDMGKACVHFKRADDLALDAVGDLIASMRPEVYIAYFEAARSGSSAARRARSAASKRR